MTFSLLCEHPSRYCIEYRNGTLHDVLTFELIVAVCAIVAILGYLRASVLYQSERETEHSSELGDEEVADSLMDHISDTTES